ncbi:MAG: dihydroorotase, partial [Nitrospirae bacterium]
MKILIRKGHIIDPSQAVDGVYDLLIDGEKIGGIFDCGTCQDYDMEIDAEDMLLIPGLVDVHTHLRQPGFTHKETIRTGTMAAVKGGFTTVCCMPNTDPVNDNPVVTDYIMKVAQNEGACTIYPIGAITKGQRGEELAPMGLLKEAGCIAFSDDGKPVQNSLVMMRALEYAKNFGIRIISHCEDLYLCDGGVMNEGIVSTSLGLKGVPAPAEEIMVSRDLILAEYVSAPIHIAHVSTKGSVELIRAAKRKGVDVTAETCPHYFSITEEAVIGYKTFAKVNPPLRTKEDVEAIKEGLLDGTIDIIATDHAPHHLEEKTAEFDRAPSGISSLETALALGLRLVDEGLLTIQQLIEKMSLNPSKAFGLPKGTLKKGADADVVIIDREREFVVDTNNFLSMGKNTPFRNWILKGMPLFTISKG